MGRLPVVIGIALSLTLAANRPASGSGDGYSCVGLSAPTDGVITEEYAPVGRYAGHWGVDYSASSVSGEGSPINSAASGVVTFSGVVVDNRTVTLDHGGGLKTSYSYLAEVVVQRGDWVPRGTTVGTSAVGGEHDAVHLSLRIDGVYVDPEPRVGCRPAPPAIGLNLVPST